MCSAEGEHDVIGDGGLGLLVDLLDQGVRFSVHIVVIQVGVILPNITQAKYFDFTVQRLFSQLYKLHS